MKLGSLMSLVLTPFGPQVTMSNPWGVSKSYRVTDSVFLLSYRHSNGGSLKFTTAMVCLLLEIF